MKTQIKNLVNGSKITKRDIDNRKYADMSYNIAGSSCKERDIVSAMVVAENPSVMRVNILGEEVDLYIKKSISGKTWSWESEITEEQYLSIMVHDAPLFTAGDVRYTLVIDQCLKVAIYTTSRNNERCEWKMRKCEGIDESFVTIL